jgi:hypothetical protein
MVALTAMLHSYGNEASEWPQHYRQDENFTTTYQLLGTGTNVTNFHIQDELLCHMGHLCVPVRERAKIIWEARYNQMEGHFGMEKTMVILQKKIIGQKFGRTSTSISYLSLPVQFPSQSSRRKDYTPLFLLSRGLGNPYQWITCLASCPRRKEIIVYLWWLIGFRRWKFS